jgi:hypothetical protein
MHEGCELYMIGRASIMISGRVYMVVRVSTIYEMEAFRNQLPNHYHFTAQIFHPMVK